MSDVDSALGAIAAGRAGDPLAPVTVIVPSHAAGLQLRRRLAGITPFAGVRFETLPRIAELLGAGHLAAVGRAPLARPIRDYVAERVALESRGALRSVADLPGYARALRRIFRRLRRGGVRSSRDIKLRESASHLNEVLRLYDRFRQDTEPFYDEEDLLEEAAAAVHARRAGALEDLGAIYVLPPPAQTAGAAALLAALREAAPHYEGLDDTTGEPEVRVVLAPDPANEAREVVRDVLFVMESGIAVNETAVFHGADEAYPRLLLEAFEAAGIPAVPLPGIPLNETAAGRGVLTMAELPGKDFSRALVIDFLSVAPLKERLPAGSREVSPLTAAWDRLSRQAGITHGGGRWLKGLSAMLLDNEAQARSAAATENESWARALEFERQASGELLAVVATLIARLETLRPPQPAGSFIEAFKRAVADYFNPMDPALGDVLAEIEQLGTVAAVGGSFSLKSFALALAANLEAASVRPAKLGEGVVLADYRLAAGLRFKHVVLCAAYEGALPANPGTGPIIEDRTWARLRDEHPYIEDSVLRNERSKDAAMRAVRAAAGGTLTWSSPLYEPGGTREYYPSPLVVQAAARLESSITTASALRGCSVSAAWLRKSASPLAGSLQGPALDAFEMAVRRAVEMQRRRGPLPADHARRRVVAMLRARRSTRFTEWDGNLSELSGSDWLRVKRTLSPTSLENYGLCGFRYLCSSLFRLKSVKEPEELEMMEPAARGQMVHAVLDSFFKEMKERGRLVLDEPWTEEERQFMLSLLDQALADARERGQTGLAVFGNHEARILRSDLLRFLEEDYLFRMATRAIPAEFESPVSAEVAGVQLRGRVDRMDRTRDSRMAWVIDYKTGSASEYKAISGEDPLVGGTRLQLPAYLAAVRDAQETKAMYWFVTHRGGFEKVEYVDSEKNRNLFEHTVASISAGIQAGAFPPVSGDEDEHWGGFKNCRYCDFDRICSRRRDDELEAKAADPAIAPWFEVGKSARHEGSPQ